MQNLALLEEMEVKVKFDFFDYITERFFKNEPSCVEQMREIKELRKSSLTSDDHSPTVMLNKYALNIALRSYQFKIENLLAKVQSAVTQIIDSLIIDYAIKDYEHRITELKYKKECLNT